ncbi:Transcription initiation factor TFIID subunit 12 [Trapelia coarctata]|nr:Transcription initiation factor TFIID subunit 12 [Trapelia coarctata]
MDPQPQLPSLEMLIKPNQVASIACLDAEEKQKYVRGISEQWSKIQNHPQLNHPERVKAHRTLFEVTSRLQKMVHNYRQQHGQAGPPAGSRPVNQGQQGHPGASGPSYPTGTPASSGELYSEAVKQAVRNLKVAVPPDLYGATQEARQVWTQNERRKYAQLAQTYEKAVKSSQELSQFMEQKKQQNKAFSEQEMGHIKTRQQQFTQNVEMAKLNLQKFKRTQDHYHEQLQTYSQSMAQGGHALGGMDSLSQQMPQAQANAPAQPTEQPSQSVPVNPALEAARSSGPQPERSSTVSAGAIPQGQVPSSQSQTTQPQPSAAGGPVLKAEHPAVSTASSLPPHSQPQHSPQPAAAQVPTSQGPHPLTHQAAMAQVQRSYSQPNVTPANPNSNPHAHPSMPREPQPQSKWNTPKNLVLPPLAPVQMGPSRPTLSGGPSTGAAGPIGQPALQKHPGFVLEGEGDRVLSKKKLEELVRQVTGNADPEGAQLLDPEVEETLLDVADEFVDNVISAACKLAKLRGSTQLEIRDIQVILERNYNLRVPGYASDELRTVRKIQPTASWAQKVAAVNASKLTGGKGAD